MYYTKDKQKWLKGKISGRTDRRFTVVANTHNDGNQETSGRERGGGEEGVIAIKKKICKGDEVYYVESVDTKRDQYIQMRVTGIGDGQHGDGQHGDQDGDQDGHIHGEDRIRLQPKQSRRNETKVATVAQIKSLEEYEDEGLTCSLHTSALGAVCKRFCTPVVADTLFLVLPTVFNTVYYNIYIIVLL